MPDEETPGTRLRASLQNEFGKRDTPASVAMIADVYANLTIIHESLLNLTRLVIHVEQERPTKDDYQALEKNLQEFTEKVGSSMMNLAHAVNAEQQKGRGDVE